MSESTVQPSTSDARKRRLAALLLLLPLIVAGVAFAYWVYVWNVPELGPAFKPIILKLLVNGQEVGKPITEDTVVVASPSTDVVVEVKAWYPWPWQLLYYGYKFGTPTPYYYYYYEATYEGVNYYYGSFYYYGYYSFQGQKELPLKLLLSVKRSDGSVGYNESDAMTIMMGETKTFTATVSIADQATLKAMAWTGMISEQGTAWASLATPLWVVVQKQ